MTDDEIHEHFMRIAMCEAELAEAAGEVPTGCVIVERPQNNALSINSRIIGRGHNETEGRGNPTSHAEMLAIAEACAARGDFRLTDTVLYVTKEPCAMCAGAILQSRINRVVYGAPDPKGGAVRSLFQLLEDPRLNWRCQVVPGVLEEECAETLRQFFRERRARGSKT